MVRKIFQTFFPKTFTGIDKNYVSPIDIAIQQFNKTHTLSASQIAEIKKNERVAYLRDHAASKENNQGNLW